MRLANADAVIANINRVITIRRGHATDGNFGCAGMFNRVQHRFTDDLQQMHLHLRVQRQGR